MRNTIWVLASVALAMLVASGVAWAANIQCPTGGTTRLGFHKCWGTAEADTMIGTPKLDYIYGKKGADKIYGRARTDGLFGGRGPDKLYGGGDAKLDALWGNEGPDQLYGGRGSDRLHPNGVHWDYSRLADTSDDQVHGGKGDDIFTGYRASSGVDRLYGEDGNDDFFVEQRRWGDPVTKEIVDCGAGTADEVWFDEGVDDVMDNCEINHAG
jgi:Ca2+-binding RTX toxin-like protein